MKQKKAHVVMAIAICFALMSLVGCASSEDTTTSISPPVASTDGAGSDVLAEWGLRGEGNETTEPFDLTTGTTVFQASYSGTGPFMIDLLDSNGSPVEQIAAGAGAMSVTKNVTLQQGGTYSLRVAADGPWELTASYGDNNPGVSTP